MAIWMVNWLLGWRTAPFWGKTNFAEGIRSMEGITPIGAGLHEPDWICFPSVMGKFGTVKQKLMKLLVDVREGT